MEEPKIPEVPEPPAGEAERGDPVEEFDKVAEAFATAARELVQRAKSGQINFALFLFKSAGMDVRGRPLNSYSFYHGSDDIVATLRAIQGAGNDLAAQVREEQRRRSPEIILQGPHADAIMRAQRRHNGKA